MRSNARVPQRTFGDRFDTFGVWSNGELVPVTRAYSGLSNAEIQELDRWIRSHTLEKFGPVRAVEPTQVFELAYEGKTI